VGFSARIEIGVALGRRLLRAVYVGERLVDGVLREEEGRTVPRGIGVVGLLCHSHLWGTWEE
jgi:hypothetical protein